MKVIRCVHDAIIVVVKGSIVSAQRCLELEVIRGVHHAISIDVTKESVEGVGRPWSDGRGGIPLDIDEEVFRVMSYTPLAMELPTTPDPLKLTAHCVLAPLPSGLIAAQASVGAVPL